VSVLMIFRIALKALGRNKLRTALTMLGMIIGVAAVIAMVALGTGDDGVLVSVGAGDLQRLVLGLPRAVVDVGLARPLGIELDVQVPRELMLDPGHVPAGLLGRREVDVEERPLLDATHETGEVAPVRRILCRRDGPAHGRADRAREAGDRIEGAGEDPALHAAHPLGLGAPIVGDRLYGREGARMLLHAEGLAFEHPRTGERMTFELPAPF